MTELDARAILDELQRRMDTRDLDVLVELFTEDALLIGTAAYNAGREAVRAYLARVLDQPGRIVWDYDRVDVYHRAPGELGVSGLGSVGFADEAAADRDPFRLTVLAVETDAGWRLRMFHGSVPQA
jgi:uncharacterized protein (TIGR02246 family)